LGILLPSYGADITMCTRVHPSLTSPAASHRVAPSGQTDPRPRGPLSLKLSAHATSSAQSAATAAHRKSPSPYWHERVAVITQRPLLRQTAPTGVSQRCTPIPYAASCSSDPCLTGARMAVCLTGMPDPSPRRPRRPLATLTIGAACWSTRHESPWGGQGRRRS